MATLKHAGPLDGEKLANLAEGWLRREDYKTELVGGNGQYVVKGRKRSFLRTVSCSDRAMEVTIRAGTSNTEVEVKVIELSRNIISATLWTLVGVPTAVLSTGSVLDRTLLTEQLRAAMHLMAAAQVLS